MSNDALREAAKQARDWIAERPQDRPISAGKMCATIDRALASSKPEPQAQAGEPECVKCNPADYCAANHTKLITLQSHREAIDGVKSRAVELLSQGQKALAKKDAALQACVDVLQEVRAIVPEQYETLDRLDAAITKAQEALNE